MTNDYKETLLDYVTGNLQNTSPTTDEIFKEIIEANRSDWTNYLPSGWNDFHFEGIIQEQNSNINILYGGYRATDSTALNNNIYGIIVLLDDNFKPFKTFYEYENGTKLRYIQNMKQAEDNSFYMVDDTNFGFKYDNTILTSTKRLVMLNNFTNKVNDQYKLNLRSSYIFPVGYNVFKCKNLMKNPEQAQYVMIGSIYDGGGGNYLGVSQIELNIPYGSAIEWKKNDIITYVSTTSQDIEGKYLTSIVKFKEDTYQINVICGYFYQERSGGQPISTNRYIRNYYKSYSTDTYSYTNILTNPEITGSSETLENQSIFLNENLCYFVLDNINNTYAVTYDLKIQLWEYNLSSNIATKIYEKSYGTGQPAQQEQIFLSINQGYLYIEDIIKKTSTTANYYVQRYKGIWKPILVSENKPYQWNQRNLYVVNNYNLLKIFLFPVNPRNATWYFPIIKEIYNPNQYNGQPYMANNVLSPEYANLYSNGSLIFSRNLYNISKQNNMMMASVEIPNNYLNDLTISQNDLISETNLQMNSDTTSWTKNIYEVVDMNFLNTISVIDNDTNTPYLLGATRINNSITDINDYSNATCNKVRINYVDNTTKVFLISWEQIDSIHKQTTFSIYVDKAMKSIDYISNDTNTIYCNKPLNVEVGNYYTINQKIMIGE